METLDDVGQQATKRKTNRSRKTTNSNLTGTDVWRINDEKLETFLITIKAYGDYNNTLLL